VNLGGINNKMVALHLAAENGYTDIVKLLLQHPDINVNIKNEE
jgi:ankyrin repeat protein